MMNPALEKLKEGIRSFQQEHYPLRSEDYRKAASEPQRPHSMILACADSRVDIELITASGPGDVFIARNVGNMVPSYGELLGGVSAVIEYAVSALEVQHIAICGHSDCGAMKALLDPASLKSMPTVKLWMNHGQAALKVAEQVHEATGRDLLTVLTEQNVLMQLNHLRTHPSVAGAMARGILTVSGWVYDIGSGEIRISENGVGPFEVVSVNVTAPPATG